MYNKTEKQHIIFMLKWLDKNKDKRRIERYKKRLLRIQKNEK